jgi:hypothetical protein
MINFGVWQGHLSSVIRDPHRNQARLRRQATFGRRDFIAMPIRLSLPAAFMSPSYKKVAACTRLSWKRLANKAGGPPLRNRPSSARACG